MDGWQSEGKWDPVSGYGGREWEGCGWRSGYGRVHGWQWLDIISHLYFFLTSSNCIPLYSRCLRHRHRNQVWTAQTLPWQTNPPRCHLLSATLKSPQVPESQDKKIPFKLRQQEAVLQEHGGYRERLFSLQWFLSTSVQIRCHYWVDEPGHFISKGEGRTWTACLNKNATMAFIVTLAQTHPHTPGRERSFQWNTPSLSIKLIWLIMNLSGPLTETWVNFFSLFVSTPPSSQLCWTER